MEKTLPFIVNFKDIDKEDVGVVGGKGENLGEIKLYHLRGGISVFNLR